MNMIDRVVFALQDVAQKTDGMLVGTNLRPFALAAVTAMREPTETMADAPDVFRYGAVSGHFDVLTPKEYAVIWRAMIDAALADAAMIPAADTTAPT